MRRINTVAACLLILRSKMMPVAKISNEILAHLHKIKSSLSSPSHIQETSPHYMQIEIEYLQMSTSHQRFVISKARAYLGEAHAGIRAVHILFKEHEAFERFIKAIRDLRLAMLKFALAPNRGRLLDIKVELDTAQRRYEATKQSHFLEELRDEDADYDWNAKMEQFVGLMDIVSCLLLLFDEALVRGRRDKDVYGWCIEGPFLSL